MAGFRSRCDDLRDERDDQGNAHPVIVSLQGLRTRTRTRDRDPGLANPEPRIPNPEFSVALLHFVERPRAAADGRADERALLAAEDGAETRARRRRSADAHRRLLPIAAGAPLDGRRALGWARRARNP